MSSVYTNIAPFIFILLFSSLTHYILVIMLNYYIFFNCLLQNCLLSFEYDLQAALRKLAHAITRDFFSFKN